MMGDAKDSNKLFYLGLAIVVLYLLPFFFLWQDSKILVWDTLQSWFSHMKTLVSSGTVFAGFETNAVIPQIMNGLPRNLLASEFNFFVWGQTFLGIFPLFILNIVAMHLIAFVGMYLLLKKHFFKEKNLKGLAVGVALCFALLPFNPLRVLGIAAMPLVIYAFLNIRNGNFSKKDWGIILIYPFFSSFLLTGVFFLCGLCFFWAYDFYRNKKPNKFLLLAIFLFGAISLVTEYRMFLTMFFGRLDFIKFGIVRVGK